MTKKLLGLLAVLALAAGVASATPSAASRGPNLAYDTVAASVADVAPVTARGTGVGAALDALGSGASAAEYNNCGHVYYPDGALMAWMCNAQGDLSGPTWYSGVRIMWNRELADGGHSDTMYFCDFGGSTCSAVATDDETESISWTRTLYDTNAMYVKLRTTYGSTVYWRCVWWGRTGGFAVTAGSTC